MIHLLAFRTGFITFNWRLNYNGDDNICIYTSLKNAKRGGEKLIQRPKTVKHLRNGF